MPPQQSQNQPNFDFIMNPNQPSAKKSLLPAGNSTKQRVAIVAIIGGVLLVFLLLLMLILGGGGDNKQNLLKVAQQQTEIVRIANMADQSNDQSLKNLAANTSVTIASDQSRLAGTLAGNGIAFKKKELALGQNSKTDQVLEDAKAAANFDAVLRDTLIELLTDYQASVKLAYENSGNADVKNQLDATYINTGNLLKQAKPQTAATP